MKFAVQDRKLNYTKLDIQISYGFIAKMAEQTKGEQTSRSHRLNLVFREHSVKQSGTQTSKAARIGFPLSLDLLFERIVSVTLSESHVPSYRSR